jgi:hypothetical protein
MEVQLLRALINAAHYGWPEVLIAETVIRPRFQKSIHSLADSWLIRWRG